MAKLKVKVDELFGSALKVAIGGVLAGPGGLVATAVKEVADRVKVSPKITDTDIEIEAEKIKDKIVDDIASNPVLVNQLSLENPITSRTAQGGFAAVVLSAWTLYKFGWLVPVEMWNMDILYPALGTFLGGAWVLWGRLKSNLPPTFSWLKGIFG